MWSICQPKSEVLSPYLSRWMMFPCSSSLTTAGSPNDVTIPLRQTCSTNSRSRKNMTALKDGLRIVFFSAAAARRAASVALQAGAVTDEREVAARAAIVAFIAFEAGFRRTLGVRFPLAALSRQI